MKCKSPTPKKCQKIVGKCRKNILQKQIGKKMLKTIWKKKSLKNCKKVSVNTYMKENFETIQCTSSNQSVEDCNL